MRRVKLGNEVEMIWRERGTGEEDVSIFCVQQGAKKDFKAALGLAWGHGAFEVCLFMR